MTMASEPTVAYVGRVTDHSQSNLKNSMTVDEYFDMVKKALDKRYENL